MILLDLDVIDDPATAIAALDPLRARILEVLGEPGSATTIAATLGLTRQQVNYHVRALEEHGLVELVEERPRRGLVERVMTRSARSYVVSPAALGATAADPARTARFSTQYVIALGARIVREVAELARDAQRATKPLATLAIDTDIRFASPAARAAFTEELTTAITRIAARHHDEHAAGGRWHRLVVVAHPRPAATPTTTPTTATATAGTAVTTPTTATATGTPGGSP